MPGKSRSLRKKLAASNPNATCFYCGLPFDSNPLKPTDPLHKTFSTHARMTLEHLEAVTKGGASNDVNCRLAHAYCNVLVKNLTADKKAALKRRLYVFVAVTGLVPWVNKPKAYQTEKLTSHEEEALRNVKGGKPRP